LDAQGGPELDADHHRYFLDSLRALCAANKKDYYDRLCYVAAD
jgi:hypothetical protein